MLSVGVILECLCTLGQPITLEKESDWLYTITIILGPAQAIMQQAKEHQNNVNQFLYTIIRTWKHDSVTKQGNSGLLNIPTIFS